MAFPLSPFTNVDMSLGANRMLAVILTYPFCCETKLCDKPMTNIILRTKDPLTKRYCGGRSKGGGLIQQG